jgi:DNA-repair protein complementing XP-A cells
MPESSTTALTTQLTQEQLDRIAANKAQALERLRAKRKAIEQDQKEAPKKAKWIKTFYEYDLSTLENSKGGFIVDESAEGKAFDEKKRKEKSYAIEPYYRKFAFRF